jgi:sec-independent protein translocase protein TatA
MIGDLFDSPWKVLIVAVVLIVLFGSKKLPDAARSLGKSMRILKTEVGSLHQDEPGVSAQASAPGPTATAVPQAELAPTPQELQQQIRDLQRAAAMDPAPAEAQRTQQPT